MGTLETLLEVLHRRLVPRGFLPLQRIPAREMDLYRLFQWVRQYGEVCLQAVERNLAAPLQPGETVRGADSTGEVRVVTEPASSSTDPGRAARPSRSRSRSRSVNNQEEAALDNSTVSPTLPLPFGPPLGFLRRSYLGSGETPLWVRKLLRLLLRHWSLKG